LDIVETVQRRTRADGLIRKVTVQWHVSQQDNLWEVNLHPRFVDPNEATASLGEVGAKTVKRDDKPRNMENIAHKNALPVEGDDRGAPAKYRNEGIVPHAYLEIRYQLV
jgi:hypothetical protein